MTYLVQKSNFFNITVPLTNNTFGEGFVLESGKAKVTDLHRPCCTSNEDVITLQVTMYHWRSPAVKEQQTFEDLSTPVLENLQVDLPEPSYIPAPITQPIKDTCKN